MLVIDPAECIDCGVCEPECPADAIRADTEEGMEPWVTFNEKYAKIWPVITEAKDPLPTADALDGQAGKLESHFSQNPASAAA